jgi:hypothetical protein
LSDLVKLETVDVIDNFPFQSGKIFRIVMSGWQSDHHLWACSIIMNLAKRHKT